MKLYKKDRISLQHNNKTGEAGTIDTFRGCPGCELKNAPCYASKGARMTGIDFFTPVKRDFDKVYLRKQLSKYKLDWVRIGCISDPSLDWSVLAEVASLIREHNKTPVIITKLYNIPTKSILEKLNKAKAQIQVSVCGITPKKQLEKRKDFAIQLSLYDDISVSWRIISARWKKNSKPEKTQDDLILFARKVKIPIIDTPLRLFKTSPFWKLVNQEQYHRHLSPISGKLDNQRTAGLIIPYALPCYSTCAAGPKGNDPVGCKNQCNTRQ